MNISLTLLTDTTSCVILSNSYKKFAEESGAWKKIRLNNCIDNKASQIN